MTLPQTPSQTIGPFFAVGLPWPDGPEVVAEGTPGAVRIGGRVLDGAGDPVPDALVETWQADPAGGFTHPDDPRGPGPRAVGGVGGGPPRPAGRGGRAPPTPPGAGAAGRGGGPGAAPPTPRAAGPSAPSSRGRCRRPTAASRPRTSTCRCSPGGCWAGW